MAIWTEEQFLEQVNALPRPITRETANEYNKLRALGRRRGFAWPYRVYVDPQRRANPIATNADSYINDGIHGRGIPGVDDRPIEQIDHDVAIINSHMQTKGLFARIGNWDYFARDGYLWRSYMTLPLDRDGYRDQAERCAPLTEADTVLELAREGRYFGPE